MVGTGQRGCFFCGCNKLRMQFRDTQVDMARDSEQETGLGRSPQATWHPKESGRLGADGEALGGGGSERRGPSQDSRP
jgi:predicted  nucleic acid-binding Zn-ribbon protein